jgi:hypothetical protein
LDGASTVVCVMRDSPSKAHHLGGLPVLGPLLGSGALIRY